jgi:predicted helicase
MDYPRRELKDHVAAKANLCLIAMRQTKSTLWRHGFVSDQVASALLLEIKDIASVFPLYCYDTAVPGNAGMFQSNQSRSVNLNPDIVSSVATGLGLEIVLDGRGDPTQGTMGPEDLFAYIYAVLHSPVYRERYTEFLKTDFPRIPFTKDRDTFVKLADLGQQLIDLHLMRSPELDNPISRFCGKGDSAVTKVEYDADRGRVSINPTQYFDGVTPELWSYQIGGYQVLAKWLKDRKGRFLTSADTIHYSRVVTVLQKTIGVQGQVDVAFQTMPQEEILGKR